MNLSSQVSGQDSQCQALARQLDKNTMGSLALVTDSETVSNNQFKSFCVQSQPASIPNPQMGKERGTGF